MKEEELFPDFEGWSDGYASFTCSFRDLDVLIEYIRNQQQHHLKESFDIEYRRLIEEAGIKIDEAFFL
jgi:hypothetical protein